MRILIPLDGSRLSDAVVSHVRRLFHGHRAECEVRLLHVIDPAHPEVGASATARTHLWAIERLLESDGLRTLTHVLRGEPVARILETVVDEGIDLVAMASHGRGGVRRFVWGSVAERVLRACPVSVFVVTPRGLALPDDDVRYRRILVVIEDPLSAAAALEHTETLARASGADVLVLPSPAATGVVGELAAEARRAGVQVLAPGGDRARGILRAAQGHAADLLVLCDAPRTQLSPWPLEGMVDAVVRRADCPVLLLRQPTLAGAGALARGSARQG